MAKNEEKNIDVGKVVINWTVPEFEKVKRSKKWYIIAAIVILVFMGYAIYTANYLFALIIILSIAVFYLNDIQNPSRVEVAITSDGVVVGNKFYNYDGMKNFAIVYKPNENIKQLYFEFKSAIKQRLSIPLENANPLIIRENLLKYLEEDLERTDPPLSENLTHILKL